MSLKEILDFANQHQISFLSTTDGNQPRVRGFLLWFADETGFYFHTGKTKNVYKQLKMNPKIETCMLQPEPQPGTMLRVTGQVEFINDDDLITKLVKERPFLKEKEDEKYSNLSIFRIVKGEAHLWTMKDNLNERNISKIKF